MRRYLPFVAVPDAVVVLGIIFAALTGLLVTGTTLAALPATIAQLWLVLHLVPVSADGTGLGVLPLLPTIGLIVLIAQRVRAAVRDRVSIADLLVLGVGTVAVPLLLTLIAAAMMWDAGRVFDVSAPHLGEAVSRTLLIHALAFVIGMGQRLWRAVLRRYGAPEWLVDAAATAARIFLWFAVAALLLLLVLLVAGASRQAEVAASFHGAAGVVGAALLSVLYLPNALIAAMTVMLGAEFHLGQASLSLYAIDLTALPPLPLLALIPGWAHPWSIILLVVISLLVAYVLGTVRLTLLQTLATALFFSLFILVAGYLTSGQLGHLGDTGPMHLLSGGLAFAWTAGIGIAAALLGKLADRKGATATAEPAEPAAGPEDTGKDAAPAEDVKAGPGATEATKATEASGASEEIVEGEVVVERETEEDTEEEAEEEEESEEPGDKD